MRREAGRWFGDEATHLMAAASLWHDGDRRVDAGDRRRFEAARGGPPGKLRLSGEAGAAPLFDVPPFYPLVLAPFDRWAPRRGAPLANVVLLAAGALLAGGLLACRLGRRAPWLVAAAIVLSPLPKLVYLAQPELLLLACALAGLGLALAAEPPTGDRMPDLYRVPDRTGRFAGRWTAVGLLLAVPAAHDPIHLALLLPAAMAVPRGRRRAGIALLGLSAAVVLWLSGAFTEWRRDLESVPAERLRVEAGERPPAGGAGPEATRPGAPRVRVRLSEATGADPPWKAWGWDIPYFLAGRTAGILPYFPGVILLLAAGAGRGRHRTLIWAVAAAAVALILARPFDFTGGPGALANRSFVPLYGALWLLPRRTPRPLWGAVAGLVGALFLWPSWVAPRAFPLAADGSYRHAASPAARLLPYETTLRHLAGFEAYQGSGLWLRAIRGLEPAARADAWRLIAPEAELLLASADRLPVLRLALGAGAPARLEVAGGEAGDTVFRAAGGTDFEIRLGEPRARHPMWWSQEERNLYLLRLGFPGAAPGRLELVLEPGRGSGGGGRR